MTSARMMRPPTPPSTPPMIFGEAEGAAVSVAVSVAEGVSVVDGDASKATQRRDGHVEQSA